MINRIGNADFVYKQALLRGIRDKYQFSPKIEALDSVFSPSELKAYLKSIPSEFYSVGALFDNVRNALFRVNLHIHTSMSDGSMTPAEYLEQSVRYADKVAKKCKDGFPPFVSATTDHNNFEASQEVIAMIADDSKKYKNFKFAAGCEFMFLDEESGFKFHAFEAVGLGFNPFSKELLEKLDRFNPINIMDKIKEFGAVLSYAHPARFCQGNGLSEEFVKYLRRIGVNGIESNYQYVGIKSSLLSEEIKEIKRVTKENNFFETGGTDTHGRNIFHQRAQGIIDTLI